MQLWFRLPSKVHNKAVFTADTHAFPTHLPINATPSRSTWMKATTDDNVNLHFQPASQPMQLWFRVPPKIYHKAGCLEEALSDLRGKERAVVITGQRSTACMELHCTGERIWLSKRWDSWWLSGTDCVAAPGALLSPLAC